MRMTIECGGDIQNAISAFCSWQELSPEDFACLTFATIYNRSLYGYRIERKDGDPPSPLGSDRREETIEKIMAATKEILDRK